MLPGIPLNLKRPRAPPMATIYHSMLQFPNVTYSIQHHSVVKETERFRFLQDVGPNQPLCRACFCTRVACQACGSCGWVMPMSEHFMILVPGCHWRRDCQGSPERAACWARLLAFRPPQATGCDGAPCLLQSPCLLPNRDGIPGIAHRPLWPKPRSTNKVRTTVSPKGPAHHNTSQQSQHRL